MRALLDLPEELLIKILRELPFIDLKRTRLVCKRLLNLHNEKCFVNQHMTTVKNYGELNNNISPNITSIFNLRIIVDFSNAEAFTTRQVAEFWEKYGRGVKSIELWIYSPYNHEILIEIFNYCSNLEHLSISFYYRPSNAATVPTTQANEPLSYLPTNKLKSLYFLCIDNHVAIFKAITANASALESVSIDMESTADCSNIVNEIKVCLQRNLGKLTLQGRNIRQSDLEQLFTTENQLTELQLSATQLKDGSLRKMSENLAWLEKISLSGFSLHPSVPIWNTFFARLPYLTHISLSDLGPSVSDAMASSVSKLRNLKCLHLLNCSSISDNGIIGIFGSKIWPKMAHLHISGLPKLTNRSMDIVLPNLPNITVLNLEQHLDQSGISYRVLNNIFKNNRNLESLSVHCLNDTNVDYLMPGVNNLTKLIHLSLKDYTYKDLEGLKLHQLKTLVTKSKSVDNKVFEIFKNCRSLDYILSMEKAFKPQRGKLYIGVDRMLREEYFCLPLSKIQCEIPHFFYFRVITAMSN